jgi:hypothetical protein
VEGVRDAGGRAQAAQPPAGRCANAGMGSQDGRRLTDEDRRRRPSLICCFYINHIWYQQRRSPVFNQNPGSWIWIHSQLLRTDAVITFTFEILGNYRFLDNLPSKTRLYIHTDYQYLQGD